VPVVEGYRFTGWYDAESGGNPIALGVDGTRLTGQTTLYATWILVPDTLTVTFDQNAPTSTAVVAGTMPDTQHGIPYNSTIRADLSSPVIESYHFTGWVASLDSPGDTAVPGVTRLTWDTEDAGPPIQQWYATWQLQGQVTVTFDPNVPPDATAVAGTVPGTLTNQIYNTRITPTSPIVEGYRFDGWTINSQDQTINGARFDPLVDRLTMDKFTTTDARTIALVATWTPMPAIDLVFDPNPPAGDGTVVNGTVPDQIDDLPYNAQVLTPPTPDPLVDAYTGTGYRFTGWYTATDGGNQVTFGPSGTRIIASPVYAHWTVDTTTYSITWNPNDDSASRAVNIPTNNQDLYYAAPLASPDTQILRQGYQFTGWWTGEGGTGTRVVFAGSDQTRISGNTTLHAAWTQDSTPYTVTFDPNAGGDPDVVGVPESKTLAVSEPIGEPDSTPVRPGFVFDGWWYSCGSESQCTGEFHATDRVPDPGQDVTVHARWILDGSNYTVTFDPNAGDDENVFGVPITKDLRVSDTIGAASSTIGRVGYEFRGWWYECESQTVCAGEFDPTDRVPSPGQNVTLHAKWTENARSYEVVYHANAGEDSTVRDTPINNQDVKVSELTAAPDSLIAREGYRFDGWYATCTSQTECADPVALGTVRIPDPGADIDVYAKWVVENPVQIEFAPNTPANSEVTGMPQTIAGLAYDATMPETLTPVALATDASGGYEFGGWYTDPTAGVEYAPGTTRVTQNTTLHARWSAESLTVAVTFVEDPTPGPSSPLVPDTMPEPIPALAYSAVLPADLASPVAEGHRFAGWCDAADPDTAVIPGVTRINADIVLKPVWTEAALVQVQFDANEPSGLGTQVVPGTMPDTPTTQVLNALLPAGIQSPILVGYRFTGWYSAPEGGTEYIPGTTRVSTDADIVVVTLYAQWERIVATYSVTWDPNDDDEARAAGVPANNQGLAYAAALVPPDSQIVRPGYGFIGWYFDSAGLGELVSFSGPDAFRLTAATTLHAQWQADPERYRVVYHANAADDPTLRSVPANNQDLRVSDLTAAAETQIAREGFAFTGWYTTCSSQTACEDQIALGTVRIPDPGADIHVYAGWEAVAPSTVEFDANVPPGAEAFEMPARIVDLAYDAVLPAIGVSDPVAIAADGSGGYRFSGWFDAPTGGNRYTPGTTHVTGNLTLHAQWEPASRTVAVSFSPVAPDDESPLVPGSMPPAIPALAYSAPLPANFASPAAIGHRFAGWRQADAEVAFTPGVTRVWTDITLVPTWTGAAPVSVRFDANTPEGTPVAGTVPTDMPLALNALLPGDLPVPVLVGYQFTGWYSAADGGEQYIPGTTRVSTDADETVLTLYARWDAKPNFEIGFECQATGSRQVVPGTCPTGPLTVDYDQLMPTDLSVPLAVGYVFTGWFTASAGGDAVEPGITRLREATTLYAQWQARGPLAVQFSAGIAGGAVDGTMPEAIAALAYNEVLPVSLRQPIVPGQAFAGWFTAPGGEGERFLPGVTRVSADQTLYAAWQAHEPVTVTFAPGVAPTVTGTMPPPSVAIDFNAHVAEPTQVPVALGFAFAGWKVDGEPFDFAATRLTEDVTLVATWTPMAEVSVAFDANTPTDTNAVAGTIPPGLTAPYASLLPTGLAVPVAPGYRWLGWFTARQGGALVTPGVSRLTVDPQVVYAQWEPMDDLQVGFNAKKPAGTTLEPGTVPEPATVRYHDLVPRPADPVVPGYRFDGWYTTSELTTPFDFDNDRVTADTFAFGAWTAMAPVTVAFDVGAVSPYTDALRPISGVAYAARLADPGSPGAAGFEFLGWYARSDDDVPPVDFATWRVTGAGTVTLHARWRALDPVRVRFVGNEPVVTPAANLPADIVDAKIHDLVPLPAQLPTLAGYRFTYWSTDTAGTEPFQFDVARVGAGELTLYANWAELQRFTFTYLPNAPLGVAVQGDTFPVAETILEGETTTAPPPPEATGALFAGWSSSPDAAIPVDFAAPVVASATVYAQWTVKPAVTINFDANGYTTIHGTMPHDYSHVIYGTTVLPPQTTPVESSGFKEFLGWYTSPAPGPDADPFDFLAPVRSDENITLHAAWGDAPTSQVAFDLRLDPEGLTGPDAVFQGADPAAQIVPRGRTAERPEVDPAAEGWRFTGWYTQASDGPTYSFDSTPVIEPITLQAGWRKMAGIPVSFLANIPDGGEAIDGTVPAIVHIPYNSYVPAPVGTEPGWEGHAFTGWYTAPAGGAAFAFFGMPAAIRHTTAVSAFAAWETRPAIAVTFAPGEVGAEAARVVPGTMPAAVASLRYDAVLPSLTAVPAAIGHRFTGWTDGARPVTPGVTRLRQDTTATAQWDPAPAVVQVEFDAGIDGASGLPEPASVPLNDTLDSAAAAEPRAPGYRFDGWSLTPDGPIEDRAALRANGPDTMTLYGRWTAMPAQLVVFDTNVPDGATAVTGTGPGDIHVVYDTPAAMPEAVPAAQGWRFTGWYREAEAEIPFAFAGDMEPRAITGPTTVYAGWEAADPVTVTFAAGTVGGEPAEFAPGSPWPDAIEALPYNAVLPADIPDPTVVGHRFAGWLGPDGPVVPGLTRLTEPVVLAAQWDEALTVVEVAFAAGQVDDAEGLPAAQTVPLSGYLDTDLVTEPVATAHAFAGWSPAVAGGAIVDLASTRIETTGATLTLYAQWEDRGPVQLRLDAGGREVVTGMPPGAAMTAAYNGRVELPILVGVGVIFDGWALCPGGQGAPALAPDARFTEDGDLCALWHGADPVQVTFDLGANGDSTQVATSLNALVTRPADPTHAGFVFAGWFADSALTTLFDFAQTRVSAPLTVYAKWIAIPDGGDDPDRPGDEDTDRPGDEDPGRQNRPEPDLPGRIDEDRQGAGDALVPEDQPSQLVAAISILGAPTVWEVPRGGGAGLSLTAQVSPANATVTGVSWTILAGPASVDASGFVTFTGAEGRVVVRAIATDGSGVRARVAIQAVRAVGALRTSGSRVYIQSGKTLRPAVVAVGRGALASPTDAKLTFVSSRPKVATVSASGIVKAAKVTRPAKAVITVRSGNGKTAAIKVTVVPRAKKLIALHAAVPAGKSKLTVGETARIAVRLTPTTATGVTPTFKSSNPSVLRVDKTGRIVALTKGKATVTVKAAGTRATTTRVTVR
jgi:uncharacterized repeat protein (TIGR02543 family)